MLTASMEEEFPLITVGITCFNAEKTISRAIASAQGQTWPNLDILIVDDGSEDSSTRVVKQLAEKDKRIRLICHGENRGTAVARNTIAKNIKGEFVAFFDDDDESVPERLGKQYQRLASYEKAHNADMVFCYCHRYIVNIHGERINKIGHGIGRYAPEPHGTEILDIVLWNKGRPGKEDQSSYIGQMGSGTLLMRRSIFEKTGYFDERFRRSAEIDLALRAGYMGAHYISVDEPLITQHKTMSNNKSGKKPLQYALLLREKNKQYLKENRVYWASVALAYSKFYKRNKALSLMYKLIACLASPDKVLAGVIERKIKS